MKNLKKILATVIVIAMMVMVVVPALASTSTTVAPNAASLKALSIYTGSGTSADLSGKLTRETAVTMAVLFGGNGAAAQKVTVSKAKSDLKKIFTSDSTKIATSLVQYIDWAVMNGLVNVTGSKFNPTAQVNGNEVSALIFKALGFTLQDADASYAAYKLADVDAMSSALSAAKIIKKMMTKKDIVNMMVYALKAKNINGTAQIDQLLADKVITIDQAVASNLYTLKQDPKPADAILWDDGEKGLDTTVWTKMDRNFNPKDSTWTNPIMNGSHVLLTPGAAPDDWNNVDLLGGESTWKNYSFQLTYTPGDGYGDGYAQLMTYCDTVHNSKYEMRFVGYPQGDGSWYSFRKTVNGSVVLSESSGANYVADPTVQRLKINTPSVLKMSVQGNNVKVYIDGTLLYSLKDTSPLGGGKVMIGAQISAFALDSLSVVQGATAPDPVVDTVTGSDGQVAVSFKDMPEAIPFASYFTIKQSVDGVETKVAPSAVSFDLNKTVTFTVPKLGDAAADRSVKYTVSYNGATTVESSAFTVAKTSYATATATKGTIGYVVNAAAFNYPTATTFQVFKGADAISLVADLTKDTSIYPAAAGDTVTVKILAADGSVVTTKDIVLS